MSRGGRGEGRHTEEGRVARRIVVKETPPFLAHCKSCCYLKKSMCFWQFEADM